MKTVVLPLDGSLRAEQALPQALALLQPARDRLILLRAVEPYPTSGPPHVAQQLNEVLAAHAHTYLETLAERLRGEGWEHVVPKVGTGQSAPLIARMARDEGADLIVASSHGRTGATRWLLGSVAENVARRAPCPVWLVRSQEPDLETAESLQPAAPPSNPLVVVPLDGSRGSEQSLQFVREQLLERRPRLLLLGATDLPARASRAREEVSNLLDNYLSNQAAGLRAGHWQVEHLVADGPAAASILDTARHREAWLIVMASRGRTGVDRWLVGSVAERVLRHAHCPVVLVPQLKTEEVSHREPSHAR